jgi:hypothetical protein
VVIEWVLVPGSFQAHLDLKELLALHMRACPMHLPVKLRRAVIGAPIGLCDPLHLLSDLAQDLGNPQDFLLMKVLDILQMKIVGRLDLSLSLLIKHRLHQLGQGEASSSGETRNLTRKNQMIGGQDRDEAPLDSQQDPEITINLVSMF